ncbi:MAG TPA: hypothetical protein VJP04_02290, partial [Terriglobales bacterium]|nr:hypothetical protein [Terriglobales bacterium]
ISFLGECVEALRVLKVFLSQPAEFVVVGHKQVSWREHPARPPVYIYGYASTLAVPLQPIFQFGTELSAAAGRFPMRAEPGSG